MTKPLRGGAAARRTPPGTPNIKERWAAARERGDRTFDPGVECVHGHESVRWTNSGICVECKRPRDRAYNAAHKEEHLARSRASVERRPEEVREYQRQYYLANQDAVKQKVREWELANPERVREGARRWYARNREAICETARERHRANPHPSRASNRRWKAKNKHKVQEHDALRRARGKSAATGDRREYAVFVRWVREASVVKCYWCKKRTHVGKRHIDHIIPLAAGGADTVPNLCVSCPPCNLSKNAKMPAEFSGQSELKLV